MEGDNTKKDYLKIGNQKIKSRLIVGTGKYKNFLETAEAVKASGADINDGSYKKSEHN